MVVSPRDHQGGGIVKKNNDTLIVVTIIYPGRIDSAGFIKKYFMDRSIQVSNKKTTASQVWVMTG